MIICLICKLKSKSILHNGTELGWLINSQDKQIEIYRQNQAVDTLNHPTFLSADPLLP